MKLELANRGRLSIRTETIHNASVIGSVRILYMSDLHLFDAHDGRVIDQLLSAIKSIKVHAILMGGDLVDRRAAFPALRSLLFACQEQAPVGIIHGNHDRWVGVTELRDVVREVGAYWLEDEFMQLKSGDHQIQIDGRITSLSKSDTRILCAHNPAIFPVAVQAGYDIILAGHLHGCQVVLAERKGRLYPGAWFYRWNGLRFQQGRSTLLVSRGVSDTLPLRWNCPREILLCNLAGA